MSECKHSFIGMATGVWCTKCRAYLTAEEYAAYKAEQAKPKRKPKAEEKPKAEDKTEA